MTYAPENDSVLNVLTTANSNRSIDDRTFAIASHAFYLLLDPEEIVRIVDREHFPPGDFDKLVEFTTSHNLADTSTARIRKWKQVPMDEIQEVFAAGRTSTEQQTRDEIEIRRLAKRHKIDRQDAYTAFYQANGNMGMAEGICANIGKNVQERPSKGVANVPTRDTRSSPNVTARTRIIAVLGLDEPDGIGKAACPSVGDGWIVSDFYLWIHILHGMGKSQKWITAMKPEYLVDKYGKKDEISQTIVDDYGPEVEKPIQTEWESGFVHGDPWEERVVVLDRELLPKVKNKVTMGPSGVALRDFFLQHLEETIAEAAESEDPVLILIFAHGDYDSSGGLYIGCSETSDTTEESLLHPKAMEVILERYPKVRTTLFMTSCYSGNWVETTEFQVNRPTVLAATQADEESFAFVWSHSQRHAGGLFSSATITELLGEPAELPKDSDDDASRDYREMTKEILSQMYRLCLPTNIPDYGSSPTFSDPENQEKFWKRTGYELHHYKSNYDQLRKVPPSDPHPKRNRKKFEGGFNDGNHPDVIAWKERHPGILDEDYPEATACYGSTRRGLDSSRNMDYLIRRYMKSQKGSSNYLESKMAMNQIRAYYDNELDTRRKISLRKLLISRLVLNKLANQYALALDLYKLPEIEEWDVRDGQHAETFKRFTRVLTDSRLFHIFNDGNVGCYYRRPAQYLAAGMGSAGYNEQEVMLAIEKLRDLNREKKFTDSITKYYLSSAECHKSVSTLSTILQKSWSKSKFSRRQSRPNISDIQWEPPAQHNHKE
ncbi:hypothetical protein AWENTII_009775 [Aspergillus wentii]|nr:hypothetical protein MW887_006954 [Aspergillus wentii]